MEETILQSFLFFFNMCKKVYFSSSVKFQRRFVIASINNNTSNKGYFPIYINRFVYNAINLFTGVCVRGL